MYVAVRTASYVLRIQELTGSANTAQCGNRIIVRTCATLRPRMVAQVSD